VKVKIVNEDAITVIVDQSVGEDAARVVRGWPRGVKFALIVILAADGVSEIIRIMTTTIYNDIRMPSGSHGKQFLVKVSFLIHVDDEPLFGTEQIFAMPLTAQDLIAALDKQSYENFEARVQETEQHRLEIERLQAELKKLKEKK
jgi:hypothetical protein